MDKKAVRSIKRKSLAWICVFLCSWAAAFGAQEREKAMETVMLPLALSGRIVALDPGHGGYDGGARSVGGRWEKGYNLQIALYLKEALEEMGAQVIMTREGDYALCDENPPMRKKLQDMQRRAALVLGSGAEVLVSVHMNQYRDSGESGPQTFYRADCQAGRTLAQLIQEEMILGLSPATQRKAAAGDFYMVSLGLPSVLVECGFLSNRAEAALLGREDYGKRVAQAIARGVRRWFYLKDPPKAAPCKVDGVA